MMSDHSSLSSDSEPPALEVIKTEPQADVDTDEAVKDGFVFVKESSSLKYEDLKMDIEEEILSPGTTKGRYKCSVCFTIHSSKSALATHSCIEATSPMSVGGCICCVCKQTFSRKYNLRQHQISEHTVSVLAADDKRNRGRNYTEREKYVFLELVNDYVEIIEIKKVDGRTNKMKAECWEKIALQYNAQQESGYRNVEQLKYLYDNMKRKKKAGNSEQAVMRPAADRSLSETNQNYDTFLAVLMNHLASKGNQHDSNALDNDNEAGDSRLPIFMKNASSQTDGSLLSRESQEPGTSVTASQSSEGKKTIGSIFKEIEYLGRFCVPDSKAKEDFLLKANKIILQIYEAELKMKQDELEAKRRKYAAEEIEAKMRNEIIRIELESARFKLQQIKNGSLNKQNDFSALRL